MKLEILKISDIQPYENNPRKNENAVAAVAESIKQFGFKVPIIVDGKNIIVAGHTRYKAAKKLELEEVPVIRADDLSEEQVRAFRLADNKVAELSEWDNDLLFEELKMIDLDMSEFGFDVDLIFDEYKEVEDDDFDLEETLGSIKTPVAKIGDIWSLGNHRLMCGNSENEQEVQKLVDGKDMDLLQTDPPYNVDYGSKAEAINKYGYKFSDRHIENDFMPNDVFLEFLTNSFRSAKSILKPGGVFYIWHASTTLFEFEQALKENGLRTRQQLIWNKNALVLSRQDYHWKHEPCLYGWKEGAAHYFIDDRTQTTIFEDQPLEFNKMRKEELIKLLEEVYQDKISTTVLNEDKPSRSDEHPMMKPIKLIARQIKNSSRVNERVADLFAGSGSTLMACEQLGRISYNMELDPKYVDVIIKRWENFTGLKAVLVSSEAEGGEQNEVIYMRASK